MAKSLKGQGKVAFGVFVDGLELKFAHLSSKGKEIYVHDLKTLTLFKKLDEREGARGGFTEGHEIFSETEHGGAGLLLQAERSDSNSSVLLDLLSQYPPKKYLLTYSLAEPSVYYHVLEGNFGSKNGAVKKRVLEELRTIRTGTSEPDAVDVIPSQEKGVLCVVRENGLHLIDILEEIKVSLGKRLPRIPFIDGADIALMNLVRLGYDLKEDEISLLVYVGVDFSRITFMKGDKHLHFAPLITEGTETPNLDNRLYSRILLEQDNHDIPKIHRILLTGNAHKIRLKEFLSTRFPSVDVDYLMFGALEKTDSQLQTVELCSEYAIPIATAWRALDPKNKKFSPTNLLPVSLIERQKFFKIGWHGYLVMVLIFLSTLFLTWNTLKLGVQIKSKTDILSEKEHRLADNLNLKASIEELQKKIERHKGALAVYDSLVPGSDQWTKSLTKMTNKIRELNALWITGVTSTAEGGMVITGYSLYRSRIPRYAALYQRATLRQVTVKQIREQRVYEFELYVPKVREP